MSDTRHAVYFTERAAADFDETLAYYATRSADAAKRWCDVVEVAIADLEEHPLRFALATDAKRIANDLRQVNFGIGQRLTHRMVYAVRGDRVVVYTIRHLAQDRLDESIAD